MKNDNTYFSYCPRCGAKISGQFCFRCGFNTRPSDIKLNRPFPIYNPPFCYKTEFIAILALFSLLILPAVLAIYLLVKRREYYNQWKQGIADYYNEVNTDIQLLSVAAHDEVEALYRDGCESMQKMQDSMHELETAGKKLIKERSDLLEEIDGLKSEEFQILSTPFAFDPTVTSEEHKNELVLLRSKISDMLKSGDLLNVYTSPSNTVDKYRNNNNQKQLIRCFLSESQNIIDNVNTKNIDQCRTKLQKSYDMLNKIFESDSISLSYDFLELKLKELHLNYSYVRKKELEKEEQKAIRAQMLEEDKVRREIELEKAKIEKEETQFKNEVAKLMAYMQKASDIEKQLYIDKINDLEEKLKGLEKDKENVFQREQNTRAGFVYVISNIGSFGDDVYKIGMTRRLEPMERIDELGDASVPFKFDVHAMIFSEDAPTLENILHQTFKNNQVNKVNDKKEFFRVSLSEIESVVKKNHNATVQFTQIAEAAQYRESLRIAEQIKSTA